MNCGSETLSAVNELPSPLPGRWLPLDDGLDGLDDGLGDGTAPAGSRRAFLPDPLPADVSLRSWTHRVAADAQSAVAEMTAAARALPDLPGFVRMSQLREVRYSAALDSLPVPTRETLAADLTSAATRYVDERVRPYFASSEVGASALRAGRPFDVALLGRASEVYCGRQDDELPWRQGLSWIAASRAGGVFAPPPGPDLRVATEQWCAWVEAQVDLPLIVKLSLAHLQLLLLAPFEGGAHLARQYLTWGLMRAGALLEAILPISRYLRKHEKSYLAVVADVVERCDFDSLVCFIAQAIRQTCQAQTRVLLKLSEIREAMISKVTHRSPTVRFIDALVGNPIIGLPEIIDLCDVSWGAAPGLLKRVQDLGFAQILDGNTGEQLSRSPKYGKVLYVPAVAQLLGIAPPARVSTVR